MTSQGRTVALDHGAAVLDPAMCGLLLHRA